MEEVGSTKSSVGNFRYDSSFLFGIGEAQLQMVLVNSEDLGSVSNMDNPISSCSDRPQKVDFVVTQNGNLDVGLLDNLDSSMEDINCPLAISRMVSDSVIRGLVGAVEQEAAYTIAVKESEISRLKERLLSRNMFANENITIECPSCTFVGGSTEHRSNLDFSVKLLELESEVGNQMNELKEQIHTIRQKYSVISTDSRLKLAGSSGYTCTEDSGIFTDIDRVVVMLDSFFSQVSNVIYLAKISFPQWQQEREFQAKVETMVTTVCLRSLREEFEEVISNQNPCIGADESINFLKNRNQEFSSLCHELDGIYKLLSAQDSGHINSHVFWETDEECGNSGDRKVTNHLHHKLSGSHIFSLSPPWDANGKHEVLTVAMPENIDSAKLAHLSKEHLVDYFKSEMIKMKRNHESKVHEMTEEYFRLKREYLRERGSSLPSKKVKDRDELMIKIRRVISKLHKILVERDLFSSLCKDVEHPNRLQQRVDALLSENSHLRDVLADKMMEIERLSDEVLDEKKKISCYPLVEAKFMEMVTNINHEKEEVCIKSTICEEVYGCFLRVLPTDICCINDNLCMDPNYRRVTNEVSLGEVVSDGSGDSDIENLYMESIILQELSGLLFVQVLDEAKQNFDCLIDGCIYENILQVCLAQEVWEKVELVKFEAVVNKRLKEEMLQLAASLEETGKLAEETGDQLAREKDLFDRVTQELERLRDETRKQGIFIAEINAESEILKSERDQALKKIEMYEEESLKLKQELDCAIKELNQKEEERKQLLLSNQQKQDNLLIADANQRTFEKQMESVMNVAQEIMNSLADLDNRAFVNIKKNQSRLDLLGSDLSSLNKAAILLRRRGLTYRQRLERKCLDLEKAENEVDLLGDEVNSLLSLLEKIYIALDHYSPVLKYYPGIMEILKLVKRELSDDESEISKR
ncbi:hypothetical protein SAY86_028237 [Trapa natans]|uniref:WPP domain-associated protein n=1 Tax=Trapa natans TaxID=22666 RepID=A0AAN7LYZ4_TRANT|nr:hypothetical protein SAY86_028237 [Trapa natans]